jgi:hypothetical protein
MTLEAEHVRRAKRNAFWGIGERGTLYVPIADRLWDALTAAGIPANAQLMLRLLYEFARISEYKNQPINPNGEIVIYPHQQTLSLRLRVTVKTVQNLLKVLEEIGAVRRERARGSANVMFLLSPGKLLSRLFEADRVRTNLKTMHPRAYRGLSAESALEVSDSPSSNGEFL